MPSSPWEQAQAVANILVILAERCHSRESGNPRSTVEPYMDSRLRGNDGLPDSARRRRAVCQRGLRQRFGNLPGKEILKISLDKQTEPQLLSVHP